MSHIQQENNSRHKIGSNQSIVDIPAASSAVRQQSLYAKSDKPVPDNNPFFEGRSNSLSSKGN